MYVYQDLGCNIGENVVTRAEYDSSLNLVSFVVHKQDGYPKKAYEKRKRSSKMRLMVGLSCDTISKVNGA